MNRQGFIIVLTFPAGSWYKRLYVAKGWNHVDHITEAYVYKTKAQAEASMPHMYSSNGIFTVEEVTKFFRGLPISFKQEGSN